MSQPTDMWLTQIVSLFYIGVYRDYAYEKYVCKEYIGVASLNHWCRSVAYKNSQFQTGRLSHIQTAEDKTTYLSGCIQ